MQRQLARAPGVWQWGLIAVLAHGTWAVAQERVTLENVQDPGKNTAEEPFAASLSLEKAAHFLDSASLTWQKNHNCGTCHTNYAYLMARPSLRGISPEAPQVREFFENLIEKTWEEKGPRFDAEPVAAAAALAFHDSKTTGKLHPATRKALERMWTIQREDGSWNWLKCNWPPMESDDHYGVTLAALAVGVAPDDYKNTEQAKKGMAKIREYLKKNPGTMLHHRAMVLWASLYVDDLMSASERQELIEQLLSLRRSDGGWAAATLGDWKRADGTPQDLVNSDAYATGLVIYLARQVGVPITDYRLLRGVDWLKTHQRESGRWFTRSLNKDRKEPDPPTKHFLTHVGTAFAVMALEACGQVPTVVATGSEVAAAQK